MVCTEILPSAGMRWEGLTMAGSSSSPLILIDNIFFIFHEFSMCLVNASAFIEYSYYLEWNGGKNRTKCFQIEGERELIVANDELEGLTTAATAVTAIRALGGCRAPIRLAEPIYIDN
jgi:hypothetical protein